jgi:quercetin dioxygenase-like cupin family protein
VKVNRVSDVVQYTAPNHHGCSSFRLQGWDASSAENFWVGLTHFLPGGGATHEATPLEKVYVVISGEVTVVTDTGEVTLRALDSCHIAPNEARTVINRSNTPSTMVVVMPYPKGVHR